MSKEKYLVKEFDTKVKGQEIRVCQIVADTYGNPRFVVHFTALGIKSYDEVNKRYGFKKYTAKWYGGGVVFQSYNIEDTLARALEDVQEEQQALGKRFSWLMPH